MEGCSTVSNWDNNKLSKLCQDNDDDNNINYALKI